MSVYGNPAVHVDDDYCDRIGIRTLVASRMWQYTGAAEEVEDLSKYGPEVPAVSEDELMIVGAQDRRQPGGIYRRTWTWEGINKNGPIQLKGRDETMDYGFKPGLAQVSLKLWRGIREDDSNAFSDLLNKFQGYLDPDSDQIIWPAILGAETQMLSGLAATTGKAGSLNPVFGVQDFLRMEGVYRCRYAVIDLPEDLYDFSGLVCEDLPGEPPKVGQGRNWLKVPPEWRRRGLVKEIFEEYWLSGIGGWPAPIYGDGKQ